MARHTVPKGPVRGTVIDGRYVIDGVIGHGGMGSVFRARHTGLERDVAIKLIGDGRSATQEQQARFTREARALAKLNHRAIVTVHDFGRTDAGVFYLVLELVEGETVRARLDRDGALTCVEAFAIAREVAEALSAAHEQGVLHRDLKPSNVMLTAKGGSGAQVIDFGIARLGNPDADMRPGATPYVIGTPGYIAPEYAQTGRYERAADHYALGVMLFEMLTGQRPERSSEGQTARTVEQALRPVVTPEAGALVRDLLSPDPMKRPQDLLAALDAIIATLVGPRARTSRSPKRGPGPKTSNAVPSVGAPLSSRPMVEVSAGVATLALSPEQVSEVRVPRFFIDQHLVTNADFAAFVAATGASPPPHWTRGRPLAADRRCPVVNVTHAEASAFAAWCGRRLPTDAEWERAARGPEALAFPWGDDWNTGLAHAMFSRPFEERKPGPIGVFSPQGDSHFGVSDLAQIWEWVAGAHAAQGNVVRGGPWRDQTWPATLANRSWENEACLDTGFRTAYSPNDDDNAR